LAFHLSLYEYAYAVRVYSQQTTQLTVVVTNYYNLDDLTLQIVRRLGLGILNSNEKSSFHFFNARQTIS